MSRASALILLLTLGCDRPGAFESGEHQAAREKVEQWEGPCADKSWLLATTAGSPDVAECPNKMHRMRVQVATTPSQEEVGALVFCECAHASEAADAAVDH